MKVYIASKIMYAERFRRLRTEWNAHRVEIYSRWLDQAVHENSATPDDFHIFWLTDEQDVKESDAVIVYGETGDTLRGALVEAGIAIGAGIPVIIVGDSPSFASWQYHPKVVRADSLEHARHMLLRLFR